MQCTVVEGHLVEGVAAFSVIAFTPIGQQDTVGDAGKERQRSGVVARLASLQVGTADQEAAVGGEVVLAVASREQLRLLLHRRVNHRPRGVGDQWGAVQRQIATLQLQVKGIRGEVEVRQPSGRRGKVLGGEGVAAKEGQLEHVWITLKNPT